VRAPSVCVGFVIWDPGRPSRSCDFRLPGVKLACMRLWRLPDACRLCPGEFAAAWGHRRGGGMGSVRAPSVCVGFVIWDPGRPSRSCDFRLHGVKLACMRLWRLPDACRLCPGVFAAAWGHRRGGGMGSVRAPSVCVGFVIWDPGRPSRSCDFRLPGVKLACMRLWRLPDACRLCPGVFAAVWGHRRGGGMGSVRASSVCVGFVIWDPGRPSRSCDFRLPGVKLACMRLWRLPDACRLRPGVFAAAWGHRRGGGMGSVRAPSVCVGFVIWDPGRPSQSCDLCLHGVKLACMHL
jgi:predicted alpha/beta-hydrolase family hydrolase